MTTRAPTPPTRPPPLGEPPPGYRASTPPTPPTPPPPSGPGLGPAVTPPTPSDPAQVRLRAELIAQYPWLPAPLIDVYMEAWVETGSEVLAWDTVRSSPDYDTYFAGNRRDDGTLRYDERTYVAIMDSFRLSVSNAGVNPDLFTEQFIALLEGDVSPAEFENRIRNLELRILDNAPDVAAAYRELGFAGDVTFAAIVASAMDPTINDAIFNRELTMAEVSAQASRRGFGFQTELSRELVVGAGFTGQDALGFFAQAGEQVPILQRLAARHDDPDDPFDLDEFADAVVFGDPEARRTIRQLFAAESSLFTSSATALEDREGSLIGLRVR